MSPAKFYPDRSMFSYVDNWNFDIKIIYICNYTDMSQMQQLHGDMYKCNTICPRVSLSIISLSKAHVLSYSGIACLNAINHFPPPIHTHTHTPPPPPLHPSSPSHHHHPNSRTRFKKCNDAEYDPANHTIIKIPHELALINSNSTHVEHNSKAPHYWPFMRGIHQWMVDSPIKGQ